MSVEKKRSRRLFAAYTTITAILLLTTFSIFTVDERELIRTNIKLFVPIELQEDTPIVIRLDDDNWRAETPATVSLAFVNDEPLRGVDRTDVPLRIYLEAYAESTHSGSRASWSAGPRRPNRLIHNSYYTQDEAIVNGRGGSIGRDRSFTIGRFEHYRFEDITLTLTATDFDPALNALNPRIVVEGDGTRAMYAWFSIYFKFIIVFLHACCIIALWITFFLLRRRALKS